MQTKEISVKHNIIFVAAVCLVTVLLLLSNEGRQPITYTGTELQHTVGMIDSEGALLFKSASVAIGSTASTPEYVLNKGSYTVSVTYQLDGDDTVLELWEQGSKIAAWPMPANQESVSADFTLSRDAKQLQIKVNYGGQGDLRVQQLSLSPQGLFYTDTYFFVLLFWAICILGYLYVRGGRKWFTTEQFTDICVIFGAALLATTPMMQTYLYNGDDLCYHLARLEGLKDGILDGQIPVIIQPNGLQNHGYLNVMYPYLFLYIGAFLRICRVSLALSYKTLIFLANLGSAVSAYAAVKSMTKSRRSVILAVVLYTLMPYRFTNIFSRGDLGETLALIFWPLVIAGLYHIVMGERKKWYYLVIGFTGALQSHILSMVFVFVFCVVTALLYCGRIIREKRYVEIGRAAGLTLLLNAWYLVPFLYFYLKEDIAKDVLRWSAYFEQSINLSNLTQSISLYNKQYFSLGLALLGCLGIGVVYLFCERHGEKTALDGYLLYLFVMGCLLTFMITGYFPNKALMETGSFFENIGTMLQFPWRFLGPASACFLFVGAMGLSRSDILKPWRNQIFTLLVGLSLLVILTVPTDNNHMPYANADAAASKGHESKLAANIGLFYPHEWRLDGASDDKLTTSVVVSDLNRIKVYDYQKKGTKAAVRYTASVDGYIELPILAYLGYRAYDENGNAVEITRGDGAVIRLQVTGDGTEHSFYVQYGPMPGFLLATVVSALTLALCVWYLLGRKNRKESLPELLDELSEELSEEVGENI
jgi:hypothetical protein